jgi:rhodanese-related sulfurtransferase
MFGSVKEMLAAANAVVPRLSFEEAAALVGRDRVLVVDVRDMPELQSIGKIRGAVHVSRGVIEFRADPNSPYYDKAFSRDKVVLVYCGSDGRSALAARSLQELGYHDVCNLGSIKDWIANGGAVEKV